MQTPRTTIRLLLVMVLGVIMAGPGSPAGATADDTPTRDQELFGDVYTQPLSRLSVLGGLGFGSVRGGNRYFTPSGRLAFDFGVLLDVGRPFRFGAAFNHFRFVENGPGTNGELPREVSDVAAFLRLDGRDGRLTPYLRLGGGIYFSDNSTTGDLFRVGLGLEVPLSRTMLRLEGRYSSYGSGAFLGETGRQTTLTAIIGVRFLLAPGGGAMRQENDAERLRHTLRYVAEPEEVEQLKALETDLELARFFEEFWNRRDPYPEIPGNDARDAFLHRVAIAGDRFGEMGRAGWASERGRIIIVHGQPDEVIWEATIPQIAGGFPHTSGHAADIGSASALELWIYYQDLPRTVGHQSFFLFEEDAVSRYRVIWTNVGGEIGFARSLPQLPPSIAAPISAVSGSFKSR